LRGGNLRSLGRAHEVAREITRDPKLFAVVARGMLDDDPVVRMRAADAVEKAALARPELLQPHKAKILGAVAAGEQKEVRWHVALMLPRLKLNRGENKQAVAILFEYLEDRSSIVRTFAMQGLGDFALRDGALRKRVLPVIEHLTEMGSPAMRSRGRKLLKRLRGEIGARI
jgi:HEAT repeat protein